MAVFVGIGSLSFLFGHPSITHAQAGGSAAATAAAAGSTGDSCGFFSVCGVANLFSTILLWVSRLFLQVTLFVLAFIIEVAGYNGYLSSTAVQIGWVMVRDITNLGFVIILLIIAFGTILGQENYEWKKLLTKFVMAAVLVNFSRIICGVLIDVSQVVMNTFVNGIAATAGGNLVNAFHLEKLRDLDPNARADQNSYGNTFLASVAALTFSAMVMAVMIVFLFMLLARMMVLWVLVVLSPLAFVLSVIPPTQQYAARWWSELGKNLLTGPALLFFIWLAFVTVGAGNINDEIGNSANNSAPAATLQELQPTASGQQTLDQQGNAIGSATGGQSAGIGLAMTWNGMANFAIAIGMLLVGVKTAQELGGVGAGALSGAVDFAKKVGMYGSGLAAGRYAAHGLNEGRKMATKWALMNAPGVGGKAWIRRGRNIKARVSNLAAQYTSWRVRNAGKTYKTAYGVDENGKPTEGSWLKRNFARARFAVTGPAAYKEEITKDREAGAKSRWEAIEHEASTSSTAVGREKREAEERVEYHKSSGGLIRAGRIVDVRDRQNEKMKHIEQAVDALGPYATAEEKEKAIAAMEGASVITGKKKDGTDLVEKITDSDVFDYERWEKAKAEEAKTGVKEEKLKTEDEKKKAEAKEIYMGKGGESQQQAMAQAKAEAKQIEDKLTAQKELTLLRAIKNELEKGRLMPGRQGPITRAQERAVSAGQAKAETEKEKRAQEQVEAEFKAQGYENMGDTLRADAVRRDAAARANKADREMYTTMSYAEFLAQAARLGGGGARTTVEDQNNRVKSSISLLTASTDMDAETAGDTLRSMLGRTGWNEEITDQNRYRALLQAVTGKVVADNLAAITQATQEVEASFGGDEQQLNEAMRALGAGFKKVSTEGMTAFTGIVGEGADADGKAVYRLGQNVGVQSTRGVAHVGGRGYTQDVDEQRKYWATKVNLKSAKSARDFGSSNVGGDLTGFTDTQAEAFGQAFKGMDSRNISQTITSSFYDSLNNAKADRTNLNQMLQYRRMYQEVAMNVSDKKAFLEFVHSSNGLWQIVQGATGGQTADQFFDNLRPPAAVP